MASCIQYRPDLSNCAEVAVFCGFVSSADDYCPCDEADHDNARWYIDEGVYAEPGDVIHRAADGTLTVERKAAMA